MSVNEITGDALKTKATTDQYRQNWDAIFKKEPASPGSNQLEDSKDVPDERRTEDADGV